LLRADVGDTEPDAWGRVDPRVLKTSWNNLEKLVGYFCIFLSYPSCLITLDILWSM